ncbi:MAG: hypothetical protein FJ109_06090 [Deltaproteobacteria bacterium]|nr:hypothetical protein [Deltaproteobacteria bacterium]
MSIPWLWSRASSAFFGLRDKGKGKKARDKAEEDEAGEGEERAVSAEKPSQAGRKPLKLTPHTEDPKKGPRLL